MKTYHRFWTVMAIPCWLVAQAGASFDGNDDFNDNTKNPQLWGTEFLAGSGAIGETNQHLEYTTSGDPTGQDYAGWFWAGGGGSYTQDWDLIVELHVGIYALASVTQTVGFQITVLPEGDIGQNIFSLELNQFQGHRRIDCIFISGGVQTEIGSRHTSATGIVARICYDSGSQVLSASFDEDGRQCGLRWSPLTNIVVPEAWRMTSTNRLSLSLGGHSRGVSVTSSDAVFADNLIAVSGAGPPLHVQRVAGGVALSWPTNAVGHHLEAANVISPEPCWIPVSQAAVVVDGNYTVTNTVTGASRFYRLSR